MLPTYASRVLLTPFPSSFVLFCPFCLLPSSFFLLLSTFHPFFFLLPSSFFLSPRRYRMLQILSLWTVVVCEFNITMDDVEPRLQRGGEMRIEFNKAMVNVWQLQADNEMPARKVQVRHIYIYRFMRTMRCRRGKCR